MLSFGGAGHAAGRSSHAGPASDPLGEGAIFPDAHGGIPAGPLLLWMEKVGSQHFEPSLPIDYPLAIEKSRRNVDRVFRCHESSKAVASFRHVTKRRVTKDHPAPDLRKSGLVAKLSLGGQLMTGIFPRAKHETPRLGRKRSMGKDWHARVDHWLRGGLPKEAGFRFCVGNLNFSAPRWEVFEQ
jgi:hypothetical protein